MLASESILRNIRNMDLGYAWEVRVDDSTFYITAFNIVSMDMYFIVGCKIR